MTRIVWSPRAARDLEAIHAYISNDTPALANLVIHRIDGALNRLVDFPESGRIVPERRSPQLREVIVRPYRVVYRFRDDTIELVTIFRASRRFPDDVQ